MRRRSEPRAPGWELACRTAPGAGPGSLRPTCAGGNATEDAPPASPARRLKRSEVMNSLLKNECQTSKDREAHLSHEVGMKLTAHAARGGALRAPRRAPRWLLHRRSCRAPRRRATAPRPEACAAAHRELQFWPLLEPGRFGSPSRAPPSSATFRSAPRPDSLGQPPTPGRQPPPRRRRRWTGCAGSSSRCRCSSQSRWTAWRRAWRTRSCAGTARARCATTRCCSGERRRQVPAPCPLCPRPRPRPRSRLTPAAPSPLPPQGQGDAGAERGVPRDRHDAGDARRLGRVRALPAAPRHAAGGQRSEHRPQQRQRQAVRPGLQQQPAAHLAARPGLPQLVWRGLCRRALQPRLCQREAAAGVDRWAARKRGPPQRAGLVGSRLRRVPRRWNGATAAWVRRGAPD
jgi:hypothetical protein